MQDKSSLPQSYDRTLIVLHWTMALLIIGLYALGLSIDLFTARPFAVNLHAAIGVLALVLLVARIGWRLTHPKPPYPVGMRPHFAAAAAVGHGLAYLLMAMVPIVGLSAFFLRGRALDFGVFQIPTPFVADRDLAHETADIHSYLAHALIALVVGHILVTLYHQFIRRDNLLARMWPR